jgi:hypothetical protein
MHECPNCGQACDCDGEDTWYDFDSEEVYDCCCDCEFSDEESDEDYED